MEPQILTDCEGDTLRIYPWRSGRVTLVARQGGKRAETGPFEPAELITALCEAVGTDAVHAAIPTDPALSDAAEAAVQRVRAFASDLAAMGHSERCDGDGDPCYPCTAADLLRALDGDA